MSRTAPPPLTLPPTTLLSVLALPYATTCQVRKSVVRCVPVLQSTSRQAKSSATRCDSGRFAGLVFFFWFRGHLFAWPPPTRFHHHGRRHRRHRNRPPTVFHHIIGAQPVALLIQCWQRRVAVLTGEAVRPRPPKPFGDVVNRGRRCRHPCTYNMKTSARCPSSTIYGAIRK